MSALMDRVRDRIGDKRVLALVKAFLKAGILGEDGVERDTITGTPQGGILSPLLANIALSVLDEHFVEAWDERWAPPRTRGNDGGARDWPTTASSATRTTSSSWWPAPEAHAEALRDEVAAVLAPMGLRLSEEKTRIAHIDEGFDFLGFRIQRQRQARHETSGTSTPTRRRRRLPPIKAKVRALTRARHEPTARRPAAPAQPGAARLDQLLPARGVGGDLQLPATPSVWRRVVCWLRHKHRRANWK